MALCRDQSIPVSSKTRNISMVHSAIPTRRYGCLTRMKRTRGEDIWQFRFYETTKEGLRRRRARTIGTIAQYATRADAVRAVEPFRHRLNLKHRFARPTSIRALVDLYVEQELSRLRYSTQRSYLSALNQWIKPQWGDCLLDELKPVPVEASAVTQNRPMRVT
jgi:integrase